MASTLIYGNTIQLLRDGAGAPIQIAARSNLRLTVSNDAQAGGVQLISSAAGGSALSLGNLTTVGFGIFENLDDTNFIQLGWDITGTFTPACKLMPGGVYTIPLDPSHTWKARANTADALLAYDVLNV